jgi:hypothetical protein
MRDSGSISIARRLAIIAGAMLAYDRKDGKNGAFFAPTARLRIDIKPDPVVIKQRCPTFSRHLCPAPPMIVGSFHPQRSEAGGGRELAPGKQQLIKLLARQTCIGPTELSGARRTSRRRRPVMGNYRDELVKINGTWLFSKRAVTFGRLKLE